MHLEIRGAERLSFRERQVVVLKELGHPADLIARRLGVAPATVATLYARARGKGFTVVIVLDGDPLGLAQAEDAEGTGSESGDSGADAPKGA